MPNFARGLVARWKESHRRESIFRCFERIEYIAAVFSAWRLGRSVCLSGYSRKAAYLPDTARPSTILEGSSKNSYGAVSPLIEMATRCGDPASVIFRTAVRREHPLGTARMARSGPASPSLRRPSESFTPSPSVSAHLPQRSLQEQFAKEIPPGRNQPHPCARRGHMGGRRKFCVWIENSAFANYRFHKKLTLHSHSINN
jgi:hypothetical protein